MQVRTGEPGKGKKKPRLVSTICHAQTLWNFSLLSDFLSLLPPTNFPRCSLRQERSMETNKYLYRCDRYRSFFKKERKKFAWTPHGSREGSSRRPRRQRMTPVVSVFHRFRFGHAARATRTHRVSAPTHARIYTCVGASPLLGSPPSSYRH